LISALTLGLSAYAAPADNVNAFMKYCSEHGKSYKTMEEFEMRLAMFNKMDAFITEKMSANGSGGYTLGHNKFSDYTEEELKMTRGFVESKGARGSAKIFEPKSQGENFVQPTAWDWREHGKVTPVKNQGSCGSCWAFATAASLEGAHAVETGQLLTFSESMFVSCVKDISNYGYETEIPPCCYGCNGGDADASYKWA